MAIVRRKDSKNRVLKEGEYQRKNGTFEYRWRDKFGKRHYLYAKTLNELREKKAELLRDIDRNISIEARKLTVNDLYEHWIQLKKGLKINSLQTYKYLYTSFVYPKFGYSKILELKRSDVRGFYNYLADEEHLKISSINIIHTVLHQILEFGVSDEILSANPADNALKELKRDCEVEKRKALTKEQQKLFEDFLNKDARAKKWKSIFTVMLWTGMRVGEVTGLRWCDIDLEKGIIDINHTLVYYKKEKGYSYIINTPKTKTGKRTIPMLKKVKESLFEEKERQEILGIKSNVIIDGYTDFVFLNSKGKNYNNHLLNKTIKTIIKNCNLEALKNNPNTNVLLPDFSNHVLRHTFATRMCEAGVNVKAIQGILGHSDIQTTLQIYTDTTKELMEGGLKKLADSFKEMC